MKKVLALLLACMLPFCAVAETYGISVSIDTDETLFTNYLKEALLELPDASESPQMDLYIRLIQKLLDGFGLDFAWQEDAVSAAVKLGGVIFLDAEFYEQGEQMLVTSSLLEGYALEDDVRLDHSYEEAQQMLKQLDWHQLTETMCSSFQAWLNGLEPVITYGQFAGDAYEGGTECTTWALDDADIAAMVEAVFTAEMCDALSALLNALGFDASEVQHELEAVHARVQNENAYRYLLRIVRDDVGAIIGCSLAVYSAAALLGTVSLGIEEKAVRLVFGCGVQEKNYWCEMTAKVKNVNQLTFLSGQCLEWMAEKEQRFSYVKASGVPVSNQEWYCSLTKSGQRTLWDACIYEGDKTQYGYCLSSAGAINPSARTLDCSISVGDSPYIPLTLNVKAGPVEAIHAPDASLLRCSMSDPADASLFQELVERMSSVMMARLMKLIPLDIILQLSMPQMP